MQLEVVLKVVPFALEDIFFTPLEAMQEGGIEAVQDYLKSSGSNAQVMTPAELQKKREKMKERCMTKAFRCQEELQNEL